MPTPNQQDQETIGRIRDGDIDAFADLLTRHREHVFRIVSGHVPPDRVAELAHETFVNAYRSLDHYQPTHPFPHWLARLAVRRCHDYWRQAYRRREHPVSQLSDDSQGWLDHQSEEQSVAAHDRNRQRRDTHEALQRALNSLSPEDRMVVTLVHLEERSVREAADLLGWSEINVKVRAFRARRRLRDLLEPILNPTGESTI